MAEYIERGAAIEVVKHAWAKGLDPTQCIEITPAADVVEVVRCGQCLYSVLAGVQWICVHPDQYCDCGAKIVDPGYFCGYGRRRDERE